MEAMRDVLRASLSRSLSAVPEEDRLAAAWTVACGRAMAEHGAIVGYQDGVVRIEVADNIWLSQMLALRGTLERELAKVSRLRIAAIEFVKKNPDTRRNRPHRAKPLTS